MEKTYEITKDNYKSYVFEKMPKSSHWKNMIWAFIVGGVICTIGQAFIELYIYGVGAKMFLVAGPVIVNGVTISVIIALLTLLFGG